MQNEAINWDEIPDIISKEQLYRICHISKSTALYLLQSGKIPCQCSGRKTRCYQIKKSDVIAYLSERKIFPESYSAPSGWYGGHYNIKMEKAVPPIILEDVHEYYTDLLKDYPDVVTTPDIVLLTGYARTAINNWCQKGYLQSFKRFNVNYVPKIYLIEFFCSDYFRMITRKSDWHIQVLKAFPYWKNNHK